MALLDVQRGFWCSVFCLSVHNMLEGNSRYTLCIEGIYVFRSNLHSINAYNLPSYATIPFFSRSIKFPRTLTTPGIHHGKR